MTSSKTHGLILASEGCLLILFSCTAGFRVLADEPAANQAAQTLTNVEQFAAVFNEIADAAHPFRLTGMVTMVDTNRNLFVLQDDTGAMAVSLTGSEPAVQPGQMVVLQGNQASPYFKPFPDYPYQPSGWDIRTSFEAPSNWGDYHLTRMRGYLHPPASGDYTFWIASDNSSELWLSPDDQPENARRIAFIKSGDWVTEHDWSHFPSQRSEKIYLSADRVYFVEAVSEQLLEDENLAVAWQPPGYKQSVIDGRHLSPWVEHTGQAHAGETNGVLREYWTNFSLGNLGGIIGRKSDSSMFVLKGAQVTVMGPGTWPEPQPIALDQPLPVTDDFHWVKVRGMIHFLGINGNTAVLDLAYNGNQVQVRVLDWGANSIQSYRNRQVQVEGVCEGMVTGNGYKMPGVVWTPTAREISFVTSTNADENLISINSLDELADRSTDTNHIWSGYISIRGVVTFNDRVFGKDYLFVQNDSAGIFVSQAGHHFNQLRVGQWVEVGGTLIPEATTPSLNPIVVSTLGSRPIPKPMVHPIEVPVLASRSGQWTELEGVIHSINTNGTMSLKEKQGGVSVWVAGAPADELNHYVDATLRLRGVLLLPTPDDPVLLVPSRDFIEVEEAGDVSDILPGYTTDIHDAAGQGKWVHRVKIQGAVSYHNGRTLFVQDVRGGVRVELLNDHHSINIKAGDPVEATGFPKNDTFSKTLTEGQARVTGANGILSARKLNLSKADISDCQDMLVTLEAKILTQKNDGPDQILDMQEGEHFCEAVLPKDFGKLPAFEPGSRLKITGVLDQGDSFLASKPAGDHELSKPVTVLLRSPQDVVVVRGAPWWTLKGFILLAGTLLTVSAAGLSIIFILRRRLENQRRAKFIFSRQILQSQEEERRRIAVNLHDTLGQNLLIIKNQSHLAMQTPVDEPTIRNRLHQISEVTVQAIEEVRQITRSLRPYQLDRLGLTHAVRAVIKTVSENSPIQFASNVDEMDGTFDKEAEIHIYRIIQEGINNIIKHSGATEATIVVRRAEMMVSISIRDNGRGFDIGLGTPTGFGINSIVERVWILGGKSSVESSPGHGTSLLFEIPITALNNEA
jgi:signal transduction histidine kinase